MVNILLYCAMGYTMLCFAGGTRGEEGGVYKVKDATRGGTHGEHQ